MAESAGTKADDVALATPLKDFLTTEAYGRLD